jgi:hypothetical protein
MVILPPYIITGQNMKPTSKCPLHVKAHRHKIVKPKIRRHEPELPKIRQKSPYHKGPTYLISLEGIPYHKKGGYEQRYFMMGLAKGPAVTSTGSKEHGEGKGKGAEP